MKNHTLAETAEIAENANHLQGEPTMSANVNRRAFLGTAAGAAGAGVLAPKIHSQEFSMEWDPSLPMICTGRALTVQPVLMYETYQRREQTSWRPW